MPTPDLTAAAARTWTLGDLSVNRLGFGAMRLAANPDREVARQVLRRAIELGVNQLDTAAFYGPANELIREALAPYSDELVITTKVGPGMDPERGFHNATTAAELRAQVDANLRGLGRDHLDVVNLRIMNRPGESLTERFGWLAELRDAGLIRHLGISNVSPVHLDEAEQLAPVVCVQNSYAIDSREDDALLQLCADRGVAFVPFASIAGTPAAGTTPAHADAVRAVAEAHGASEQQIRLAWTLHRSPNVLAIPGTGDPVHLEQNVAAAAIMLSSEELTSLND
ncbi:oxidoreductase [Kribbella sp. CA-293567]|uniref:oxidoreductase n=1 Tax=Kribbella sp. CA-293567 TaxID=3002436 RepID=UPI0022DD1AA7|nr:oxidoreductase [Kribbella sp. CA-293567]WBQ06302.1 oxidoreductase [Kribbella sp. CA-293567]